jgi:Fic family protein
LIGRLVGEGGRGAWQDWLEYFLQEIARMSEDAVSRATRINDLLAQWRRKLASESTNTPLRVIEILAANPFVTTTGVAHQLKLAFTTAQRAIERLEGNDMVQQTKDANRSRVYCARALLEILEEPAHLKPEAAE